MGGVTKLEKIILGVMLVAQLILLFTVEPLLAVLGPPLLAALPYGYAVLGSGQTVSQLTARRRRRALVCIGILVVAIAASFILAGNYPSMRFRIVQALFYDATILWLATIVAVSLHSRRAVSS